jgi:formylglycine-generating enzyme required for sulfatase activity
MLKDNEIRVFPFKGFLPVILTISLIMISCGSVSPESQKPIQTATIGSNGGVVTVITATTPDAPVSSMALFGTEMVSILGGTFSMGSNNESPGEKPVHTVTLSSFSMSRYEITYAHWVKVRDWSKSNGYSIITPGNMGSEKYGGKQDENHPVTNIKWYDAILWCNALSEMEGYTPCYYTSASQSMVYRSDHTNIQNDWVKWNADGYRLPTEAEWEYACRAGTTTEYNTGNSISGKDANYYDSGDSYDNGTTPVGSYSANPWGLYDMHGNVWEWCWDWYGYYNGEADNNPHGPSSGSNREERGGSWYFSPWYLPSAYRIFLNPGSAGYDLGFRPVRSQLTDHQAHTMFSTNSLFQNSFRSFKASLSQ